jgi:hypothetical protein
MLTLRDGGSTRFGYNRVDVTVTYVLHPHSEISAATKELVLVEIVRMVEACAGGEDVMKSYALCYRRVPFLLCPGACWDDK